MGQKARRTIQVLMKKHHQLSVLVEEEYVGKAQKAKELKGVAGDKAGEEQRVVGARQRVTERGRGNDEVAKKLAERHMNQLLGMFVFSL